MSRHSRLVAIRALLFAAIVAPILFNIGNNFAHAQSIAKTYAENGVGANIRCCGN